MSKVITIKDKQFKPYITGQKIAAAVENLAKTINTDLKDEFPIFLAVLNGSFMFASDLLKEITIPCEISFVKLSSYSGLTSTGNVNELIGLTENLSGRTVVIVEDIVDSGVTIERLTQLLIDKKVKQIKIATILFKPEAYKKNYLIDYVGFNIPNDFVVGYGLDYEGQGRNLKEIHVLA
jgi:hypoxanthine phosphoribosyltransferase